MGRGLLGVVLSPEAKTFVFVWALQYVVFWFAANFGSASPVIQQLGASASKSTVPTPTSTSIPPVSQNSVGGFVTIATHPLLLNYTLKIFVTNLTVMLLLSIPFFGLVYGEYIAFKLGALVSFFGTHSQLSALTLTGALLMQPFYYLEIFGFALSCSAGTLCGVTLFRPARRRIIWFFGALAVSALLLFLSAFFEASFTLHYAQH